MKSRIEDLQKRGFVTDQNIDFNNLTADQLMKKLNSDDATERTAAVISLRTKCTFDNEEYTRFLLEKLKIEPALYTRIELCNSLAMGNEMTAGIMCEYLGVIGDNQHKKVPEAVSRKKSFPLPRDIITRTLGKMKPSVIPVLIEHLNMEDRQKISELLEAIGYLIFYHPELASVDHFNKIKETLERYKEDELIVWKSVLCCSAFPIIQCSKLLNSIIETAANPTIIAEAKRSLRLLEIHK